MKKLLFTLFGVLMALPALARDFEHEYEGQTLTYTVISEEDKTVAVAENESVTGDLVIPTIAKDGDTEYTVTEIGESAFRGCDGLKSVTIGNSVESIGDQAFYACRGLTEVTIPNSVKSIGEDTFYMCSGLTKAEFGSIEQLCSIEFGNGYANPLSYAHNLYINSEEIKDLIIPESVTSIGKLAFYKCSGLTSVTIGYFVKSIGNQAFAECSSLTSVIIPNSVTSIDDAAFRNCSGLKSVTIPNSVTSIGDWAFYSCSGLTSVTIPNSVHSIGNYAFSGCNGLTKAEFGSIEHICGIEFGNGYANPLSYAHNLYINGEEIKALVIPNSVHSIGNYAFFNCSGLKSVTIPNSVTSIGGYAFSGCSGLIKSAYPSNLGCPFSDGIAFAYDPDEAIVENGWVFGPDKKEVRFAPYAADGKYFVPETCTAIGDNAYSYSSNMTFIEINDNVTSIGNGAFSNCEMLGDVILPLLLESIGSAVFENSGAIKNVVFRGPTPVEGSADVFDSSVYEYATLYVRSGRVALFQVASPWKFFFNITDKSYEKTLVSSLSFKQSSYAAEVGETIDLNDEVVILPADATDKTLTWTSSDETVATVSNGVVTVLAEGSCEITATTIDGSNLSAVCAINASSDVESVMAADGVCDVYSMSGILVQRNVKLSEVTSLIPGIYIVRQGNAVRKISVK